MFPIHNFGIIKIDEEFPTTAEVGDILYSEEDNQIYEYYDEGLGKPFGWRPKEFDKKQLINLGLTEYDINKMIVMKLPSLTTEAQLAKGKNLIYEFTHQHNASKWYYMLLCNDIHYYTVFEVLDVANENVEDIILECLQEKGVIQQINKAENENAIECWIKNQDGIFMFLLFDYSWGVISCQ